MFLLLGRETARLQPGAELALQRRLPLGLRAGMERGGGVQFGAGLATAPARQGQRSTVRGRGLGGRLAMGIGRRVLGARGARAGWGAF